MLTIYEQTWNRIVNSHNICRTSPVIQFSAIILGIYRCSTFLRQATCRQHSNPDKCPLDLIKMLCSLQVHWHLWAVALDWSDQSGVACLLLHMMTGVICLSFTVTYLIALKACKNSFRSSYCSTPFPCHAARRTEFLTLPRCLRSFSETVIG